MVLGIGKAHNRLALLRLLLHLLPLHSLFLLFFVHRNISTIYFYFSFLGSCQSVIAHSIACSILSDGHLVVNVHFRITIITHKTPSPHIARNMEIRHKTSDFHNTGNSILFSILFHIFSHGYEICDRIKISVLPYAVPYNLLCYCIYSVFMYNWNYFLEYVTFMSNFSVSSPVTCKKKVLPAPSLSFSLKALFPFPLFVMILLLYCIPSSLS